MKSTCNVLRSRWFSFSLVFTFSNGGGGAGKRWEFLPWSTPFQIWLYVFLSNAFRLSLHIHSTSNTHIPSSSTHTRTHTHTHTPQILPSATVATSLTLCIVPYVSSWYGINYLNTTSHMWLLSALLFSFKWPIILNLPKTDVFWINTGTTFFL